MKLLTLFLLIVTLNTAAFAQQAVPVKSYKKQKKGVLFNLQKGQMRVSVVTPSIIHVEYSPTKRFNSYPKLGVLKKERPSTDWSINEAGNFYNIITDSLKVQVNNKTGALVYYDSRNNRILSEPQSGSKVMRPDTVQGQFTYNALQRFNFSPEEGLYGLGQYQKKLMNYAGYNILMAQSNTNAVVPFLTSSKGYGLLWNNTSKSWFRDANYRGVLWSEVAAKIDYYFVYGPQVPKVIAGYRELTGKVPMFGKWAFGFIQSENRYKSQEEVVETVKKYRNQEIPLDVIVQDYQYWGNDKLERKQWDSYFGDLSVWNSLTFNKKLYPNPAQMIDKLYQKYNTHLMISVWPSFGFRTDIYNKMSKNGYLYPDTTGQSSRAYDAFNPKARKLYWKAMNKGLFSKGVDAWWLDSTEPSGDATWYSPKRTVHFNGNNYKWTRYLNAYSLMTTTGVYKNQRKTTNKKRVFILSRSAFTGQQRNGVATWSGDTNASWNTFQKQIAAGLNFSLAGIPYWTSDIGGYSVDTTIFSGGAKNSDYRRLFVRWFQYGAFSPLFRVHGKSIPRSIWHFGKQGSWSYEALIKALKLRYRLLPYIYSEAWQVTRNSSIMMRGLVYDFQHDPKVYNIWDQFMFGPFFLVNPVTRPDVSYRDVYLPKGTSWISFWSGETFKGGQTIRSPAPINYTPLFVKAGSIIPMGPVKQYATQKLDKPLEVRVYPGTDGHFTLYEDEGDNYNYEKGVYSTIKFNWNNAKKTLTIGKRQGKFSGMLIKRVLHIVVVDTEHGTGLESAKQPHRIIKYNGQKKLVVF